MFDKEDVNYRYAGGDPTAPSCATCEHLVAPGQCDLVRGLIRTVDVCDEYDGPLGEPRRSTGMAGDVAHKGGGAEAAIEAFREAYAKHPHAFDAFVDVLTTFREAYKGSVVSDDDEDEDDEKDDEKDDERKEKRVRLIDACDPENPNYDIDEAERLMNDSEHVSGCERCAMNSLTGTRPRHVRASKVSTKKGKKATRASEAVSTFLESYGPDGPTDEQVESAVAAYMKHYHDAEKRARLGRR